MNNSRPRAIIHTRVSTSDQAENTSHGSQLAAAMKKAEDLEADVIATFKEEISGALYEARPDIQTSLSMIEDGRADMIIFARLDRAGRDVSNLRDVRKRIERAGGQLVFADGLTFQSGAVGNLLYTQLAGFAEFEREIIRERMVAGLVAKAKAGQQVSRSVAPYGYYIPKHADAIRGDYSADEVGRYFLIEEHAKNVRHMFEMYSKGASLNDIGRDLNGRGVSTPRGGSEWKASVIRDMLRNETYKGKPAYRKTRRMVDEKRKAKGFSKIDWEEQRPVEDRIYLTAPPVVTEELWQVVNERLERARAERSGRSDRVYMLSGLFWCTKCGSRMYARAGKMGRKEKRRYPMYHCRESLMYANPGRERCTSKSFSAEVIERLVTQAVIHLFDNPRMIGEAATRYDARRRIEKPRNSARDEAKKLQREYSEVEKRERTTVEMKIEARINGALTGIYDKLLLEMATRKTEIERQIELHRATVTSSTAPILVLPDGSADKLRLALENPEVTGIEKHKILWSFVDRVYATGSRANISIDIVLFTQPKEPTYILSYREGKTQIRVEKVDPFPKKQSCRATCAVERKLSEIDA